MNISAIKFNNFYLNKSTGGSAVNVSPITEIYSPDKNTIKDKSIAVQTYDCGIRVNREHGSYADWNGTIFIDVDTKKFNLGTPENPKILFDKTDEGKKKFAVFYNALVHKIEDLAPHNFYFSQISHSEVSCHIIFYFSCERTEANFKAAEILSKQIVVDAAIRCGNQFKQIVEYQGVLDAAMTSIGQPLYISNFQIHYTGWADVKDGEVFDGECDLETIKNEFFDADEAIEWTPNEVRFGNSVKMKDVFSEFPNLDYQYTNRYRLEWIIFNYFGYDEAKCSEVWERVIEHILEYRPDKTEAMLKREFKQAMHNSRGKQYQFNSKMLQWAKENLGFDFKIDRTFVPKKVDFYEYDKVYVLNKDQKLSDIDIEWSKDKINHLFAGCSLGKTYNAKVIGSEEVGMVDEIFGNKAARVCFISPMKSINADSFKDVEGWAIVDSDNTTDNKALYGKIKGIVNSCLNVCTTWDSFVNYEMHNAGFDYIIVDEIHMIYTSPYRIAAISKMKALLSKAKGIKIIMSGTPSYEIEEFDCWKIKVDKEVDEVDTDIVFYNEHISGWMIENIKEWTQDEHHKAIIFNDYANYKYDDKFRAYGLKCDIFNTKHDDVKEYITDNHNVRSQITAMSVYGQAGINIYIDEDCKVRLYILGENGIGAVQYANRIRNKETIDRVYVAYKKSNIRNDYKKVKPKEKIDFDEAYKAISNINALYGGRKDVFKDKDESIFKMRYGLDVQCIDSIDGMFSLNETKYRDFVMCNRVTDYEAQIQVIYNRLVQNNFNVNFIYLDEDIKERKKEAKMQANTFLGQMMRFDPTTMFVQYGEDYCFRPTKEFKKICIGNLESTIDKCFKMLVRECGSFDEACSVFDSFIMGTIRYKGTIYKSDITKFAMMMEYKTNWEEYYDSNFIKAMTDDEWTTNKLTAAYLRTIYDKGIDYKDSAKEARDHIKDIQDMVKIYRSIFINKVGYGEKIVLDEKTREIYTYLEKKFYNKGDKKICINGIKFSSVKEASETLGVSRQWIYEMIKRDKNEQNDLSD